MLDQLEKLLSGGQFLKVRSACEAILSKDPSGPLTRHVLGLIKIWSGEIEFGERMLCPSIQQQLLTGGFTTDFTQLVDEAHKMRELKKVDAAIELLIRCLVLSPMNSSAQIEMGICLQKQSRHLEAEGFFRAAFALDTESSAAAFGIGMSLLFTGRPADASPFLLKSVELQPDSGARWRQLATSLIQNSQHSASAKALEVCVQLSPNDPVSLSQQIFSLHYCPTRLQGPLADAYQQYAQNFCISGRSENRTISEGKKLRLGYVSADLKEHPVSFFLEPLLREHDRARFKLFAYNTGFKSDATTERFRALFDHWNETTDLTDDQLFETVTRDKIDVLVDLSGHSPNNRLRVFGKRAAPLQITMIGAMMTTGVPAMDFRVTDEFLDPENSQEDPPENFPYGTEKPMRMRAGAVVFSPPAAAEEVAPSPVALGNPFTFGSLNDPAKITDETLAIWAEILHLAPNSRILLVRRPGNPMKETLKGYGIANERIIERDYLPLPQFLKLIGEVDLALDPFPYNGLTVTMQSCWMGVPPLTLVGRTPPARAAAMILSRIGVDDFIATSPAEYIKKAVQHAHDHCRLISIRPILRELTRIAWCDAWNYAREFEHHILTALNRLPET
jgi:protein O-GlcNAc transferase